MPDTLEYESVQDPSRRIAWETTDCGVTVTVAAPPPLGEVVKLSAGLLFASLLLFAAGSVVFALLAQSPSARGEGLPIALVALGALGTVVGLGGRALWAVSRTFRVPTVLTASAELLCVTTARDGAMRQMRFDRDTIRDLWVAPAAAPPWTMRPATDIILVRQAGQRTLRFTCAYGRPDLPRLEAALRSTLGLPTERVHPESRHGPVIAI